MLGLRREERVPAVLDVRVWGMDINKKPFTETAKTFDITRNGARISGLQAMVMLGEIIAVQHGDMKARWKVCWNGAADSHRAGQIGVHSLEPDKYLWGTPLNEIRQKTMQVVTSPSPAKGRRVHERLACNGKVEARRQGVGHTSWGSLSDVSITGCYVETIDPLPKGVHGNFVIRAEGLNVDITAEGEVRVSHPLVGYGVVFTSLTLEDRTRLNDFCDSLKGIKKVEEPLPPSPADNAAGPERPAIARVLERAEEVLRQVETQAAQSSRELDSRVIMELNQAVARTRQTICIAQQAIDLQAQGCSPFETIAKISEERVKQALVLADELVNDIDSSELGIDTPSLDQLFVRVNKLSKRLARLFRIVEEAAAEAAQA
jgi:hypothetical protein